MSERASELTIGQMITLCEYTLDAENRSKNRRAHAPDRLPSVALVNQIGCKFQRIYHVSRNISALTGTPHHGLTNLLPLSDPELRLYHPDEDTPFETVKLRDNVLIDFIDISLDRTVNSIGLEYSGPHLSGVVDTHDYDVPTVLPDEYIFSIPLKLVRIPDSYIPRACN